MHDLFTPCTTCLHHARLVYTTHDLFTSPTTCLHHARLVYTTHDLFTPSTTCLHHPRLVYTMHTHIRTHTHTLTHTHTHTYAYMACRHLTGREITRNCLESEGKSPVMSRCYARRFLSDDSFAAILTNLFSFTCTPVPLLYPPPHPTAPTSSRGREITKNCLKIEEKSLMTSRC